MTTDLSLTRDQSEWERARLRQLLRELEARADVVRSMVGVLVGVDEPIGRISHGNVPTDWLVEYSGGRFWLSSDGTLCVRELLCDQCGRWFACARALMGMPRRQLELVGREYEIHLRVAHNRLGSSDAREPQEVSA